MTMKFRLLTTQEVSRWYADELSEAFIPQERKPLPDILRMIADGRYEVWGLFDCDRLLGYAALWKSCAIPLVLLDYLGVTRSRRSEGLGSHILSHLSAQGQPMVTEAELPVSDGDPEENALRRRRIAFYVRNGFMPAYVMATCGMAWQALLLHADAPLPEIMAWHKALYGPERTDVVVPLPEEETPRLPYWVT